MIPARCYEFYKGGSLETNPFPPEVGMLKVVGIPYFNDDTSGSNHCIKQCPECGTVYKWDMEYEYLVNGSEDDINLARLDEEAGEQALKDVMEAVSQAKQRYKDGRDFYIAKLASATTEAEAKKGINFFYHNQLVYHEDATPAIPALLTALVRVPAIKLHSPIGRDAIEVIKRAMERPESTKATVDAVLKELERENKDRVDEIGMNLV